VVIYGDDGGGEDRHTVITATYGPLRGRRVVPGREQECLAAYGVGAPAAARQRAADRADAARDLLAPPDGSTAAELPAASPRRAEQETR
jgi:hypothetical protein